MSVCFVLLIKQLVQKAIMIWNKSDESISFDNKECSCFGGIKIGEQRFLAKQKSSQKQEPPNSNTNKNITNQQIFSKQSGKKSLKKQFAPHFQTNRFHLPPNAECAPQESCQRESTHNKRQFAGFLSPQNKPFIHGQNYINGGIPRQFVNIYTMIPSLNQQKFISCKNIPKFEIRQQNPQFQEPVSPLRTNIPQGATKNLENINSCIINKVPIRRIETENYDQKRTFSPISGKNSRINDQKAHICNDQKELKYLYHAEGNDISQKDKSESTRIISKLPQSQPQLTKDQTIRSCVKMNTMKSNIQINKKKSGAIISSLQTFKSGIRKAKPTNQVKKQSLNQTNRSVLKVKAHKQQRNTLKKMDDVIQIYSQPDEDQASDSDKQSVVLGRLNQYGSMIDPAISQISAAARPFQGKIMRMNSLAVNLNQFMIKK